MPDPRPSDLSLDFVSQNKNCVFKVSSAAAAASSEAPGEIVKRRCSPLGLLKPVHSTLWWASCRSEGEKDVFWRHLTRQGGCGDGQCLPYCINGVGLLDVHTPTPTPTVSSFSFGFPV